MSDNLFENVETSLLVQTSSVANDTFSGNDIVIDNDNNTATYAEVSGSWGASGLTGYNGSTTRFSAVGGKATWRFVAPRTGNYAVYVYKIVNATSDTNAKLTVAHAGGSTTNFVNYTTGTSGWHSLGTFSFTAGNSYLVTNERSNGYLRADAVLFQQQ